MGARHAWLGAFKFVAKNSMNAQLGALTIHAKLEFECDTQAIEVFTAARNGAVASSQSNVRISSLQVATASPASSGIGGSTSVAVGVAVGAAAVARRGPTDGGALGGGHMGTPTLGTAAGALGGSESKGEPMGRTPAGAGCAPAGCAQPSLTKDHGEQTDSQPHGAMQRTHAPYTLGDKPSTRTSITVGS